MSAVSTASMALPGYPATLMVDYPDRKLNRLTSFFRIFVAIPIAIILGLLSNAALNWGGNTGGWHTFLTVGGILFLPLVLMILFRNKYPKWWFDWNLAFTKFQLPSYFLRSTVKR